MHVWFIRCNGETAHNEPGTPRFVPGEPPQFPERAFNYRDECLCKGFARVGWPAAGDLRHADWRARAETNSVIGPILRQRNRISRKRRGNVLLALFDGAQVRSAVALAASLLRPVREALAVPTRSTHRHQQQLNALSWRSLAKNRHAWSGNGDR